MRHSREQIEQATKLATDAFDRGQEPFQIVAEVEIELDSRELAEAIVGFVESERNRTRRRSNSEWVSGLTLFAIGLALIWAFYRGVVWMFYWTSVSPNDPKIAVGSALIQALLIRLGWHVFKAACIGLTDSLNRATYPTVMHCPSLSTKAEDVVRYERLRLLIAEMVIRLGKGETLNRLFRQLSELELTKGAAFWLLIQAWVGLQIKLFMPPYGSRSRAYFIAGSIAMGCGLAIYLVKDRLSSIGQTDYLLTWSVLIVLEAIKRKRSLILVEKS